MNGRMEAEQMAAEHEETQPVAWALICGDCVDSTFTDREEAVEWACGLIPPPLIVPLYRSPALTEAEREAIQAAAVIMDARNRLGGPVMFRGSERAATLRGLRERMGGGK